MKSCESTSPHIRACRRGEPEGGCAVHLPFLLVLAIVAVALAVTYAAARRTHATGEFYTAGGGLSAGQNGLAIAGDYMSAASFLGIAGSIALAGFDGFF